ncbi:aryl-sulfate sulfotransferase [bacterium]|nr:aryl-sulfate sulfotransferase [bacterium]
MNKNRPDFIMLIFLICLFSAAQAADSGIQYLFPKNESGWLLPEAPVIVRFWDRTSDEIKNPDTMFEVSGSRSGHVNGRTVLSTDGKTLIFKPDQPYTTGEHVTVHICPEFTGSDESMDTTVTFMITDEIVPVYQQSLPVHSDPVRQPSLCKSHAANADGVVVLNGVSVPSDFPYIDITVNDDPDPGYIFCNYEGQRYYNLILDTDGNPVFYWIVPDSRRDFKVQDTGVLTMTVRSGFGGGGFIALDNTYAVVDTFFAPAGYQIDEHDLLILPNGHYLVTMLDTHVMDLSHKVPGGRKNAHVTGYHLVEMDLADNPVFIWRCWDYYDITDAEYVSLTQNYIDFLHTNSIAVDLDGNYLITPKLLNEITKIDSRSGDVIWRLGGKKNQFTFVGFEDFVYMQHALRVLDNGNYTIFDNGNYHNPPYSRALEFRVDEAAMTVTRVWEFRDTPDRSSPYQGNVQRLPNGHTLINWALTQYPKLTEVRPDGSKAFEMNFEHPVTCYRVFKFPWEGRAAVPFLVIETRADEVVLLFNKFGDTDVNEYRVYGGINPEPDVFMGSSPQPYMVVPPEYLTEGSRYYFRVTAVNSAGQESGWSNEESVSVNFEPANTNLITNGDFGSSLMHWTFSVKGTADAQAAVSGGVFGAAVTDGGQDFTDIVLHQSGFRLLRGHEYAFEFDARASRNRAVEARVEGSAFPNTDYSRLGPSYIRTTMDHYAFTFVMQDPTDENARAAFYAGGDNADVFIDNVSLRRISTSDIRIDAISEKPGNFFLSEVYPNPFNSQTAIRYRMAEASEARLVIYNLAGQQVSTLVDEKQQAGSHTVVWNAAGVAGGMYLIRFETEHGYGQTRKLILLK